MNQNVKLDKQIITSVISSQSHDGRGITLINQKKTFVSGALPGETVTCQITKKRSHYYEAKVVDILTPSPERTVPACSHFQYCGGCSLQHMNLQQQITLKQQTLLDQLKHFGKVTPRHLLAPLSSQALGYRRKARLGVKYVIKKNKLLVGFMEKSSRYLADIEQCPVLHPRVGLHLIDLRDLIASLQSYNQIAQVEVAVGDEEVALVFRHLQTLSSEDEAKLMAYGKTHQIHIYLQPNPPAPIDQCWPPEKPNRLTYTLPDYQLTYLFHPLDFTQINLEMNRLMVKQALDLLAPQSHETVLDLFCGIGNFTLPLARFARQAVGIEGHEEMTKRAYANAAHNQLHNVEFHAANLMAPLKAAPWLRAYDKLLLDPPRLGAAAILEHLPTFQPQRIVYVSCNPATLARDAGEIVHRYGYELNQVGMMNMFPHTAHIEAMAVFDKK